jgi:hypothetical protein
VPADDLNVGSAHVELGREQVDERRVGPSPLGSGGDPDLHRITVPPHHGRARRAGLHEDGQHDVSAVDLERMLERRHARA